MESTGRLPEDPALPALEAIRIKGLARAIPGLELDNDPVELRLCNYVAGSRATFEARVGDRRFAVKAYAEDPAPEAQLYRRLSRMGLAGDFGARVPKLIMTSRELKVLVMSWLEGRPLSYLIRRGLGERAGQLAASWLWHASRRRIRIGPPCGSGRMLYQAGVSSGVLGASDRLLVAEASRRAELLMGSHPILLAEAPTTFARIRSIFTARPRVPGLVQPAVPMAKVGPDPKNAGGNEGARLR